MKLRSRFAVAVLALISAVPLMAAEPVQGPPNMLYDNSRALRIYEAYPDKDRDLHILTNSGINGQAIGPNVALKSATPIQLPDYSEVMAQVSWTFATATDSDSVNIEVYFIGKLSTNISDGIDMLWDSDPTTSQVDGYYITRNSNLYSPAPGWGISAKRYAGIGGAQSQFALLTTYSVTIPIMNTKGGWMHAPYFECVVQNRNNAKTINVSVDYWPKVR